MPGHAQPGRHDTDELVDPAGHQMPEPQLRQVVFSVAPTAAEYLPDGHAAVSRPPPPQK